VFESECVSVTCVVRMFARPSGFTSFRSLRGVKFVLIVSE
jgi:hypothetical protein